MPSRPLPLQWAPVARIECVGAHVLSCPGRTLALMSGVLPSGAGNHDNALVGSLSNRKLAVFHSQASYLPRADSSFFLMLRVPWLCFTFLKAALYACRCRSFSAFLPMILRPSLKIVLFDQDLCLRKAAIGWQQMACRRPGRGVQIKKQRQAHFQWSQTVTMVVPDEVPSAASAGVSERKEAAHFPRISILRAPSRHASERTYGRPAICRGEAIAAV